MAEDGSEWDADFVAPWYGLPAGTATASVTPICQATLCLLEEEIIIPAVKGAESRRPALTFLIEHNESKKKMLFDLGIGTTWLDYIPKEHQHFYEEFKVDIKSDMDTPLAKRGIKPEDIDFLLISHRHFDHCGRPEIFTRAHIILGPTEREEMPVLQGSSQSIESLAWSHATPPIASFEYSYDLFGDGSVVLVDTSGHTSGHYAALVRTDTSPNAYVLLAADVCHHHTILSQNKEYKDYRLAPAMYDHYRLAGQTVVRTRACEKREDIMCVPAHDEIQWKSWGGGDRDGWGPELNGWQKKGLKEAYTAAK